MSGYRDAQELRSAAVRLGEYLGAARAEAVTQGRLVMIAGLLDSAMSWRASCKTASTARSTSATPTWGCEASWPTSRPERLTASTAHAQARALLSARFG